MLVALCKLAQRHQQAQIASDLEGLILDELGLREDAEVAANGSIGISAELAKRLSDRSDAAAAELGDIGLEHITAIWSKADAERAAHAEGTAVDFPGVLGEIQEL